MQQFPFWRLFGEAQEFYFEKHVIPQVTLGDSTAIAGVDRSPTFSFDRAKLIFNGKGCRTRRRTWGYISSLTLATRCSRLAAVEAFRSWMAAYFSVFALALSSFSAGCSPTV